MAIIPPDVLTPAAKLRENFLRNVQQLAGEPEVLVVVVQLPDGAFETITNYQNIGNKISYYIANYDMEFRLRANPKVRIVGYILL